MYLDISALTGKVIVDVEGLKPYSEKVIFTCDDGTKYAMYHSFSCCENVSIEDIVGDVDDLIGQVIYARKETNENYMELEFKPADFLWTFYIIQTTKGCVTIRWFGSSNGLYSIEVNFAEL